MSALRVGLLVPSNNVVLAGEFAERDAGGHLSVRTAILPATGAGERELRMMATSARDAAAALAAAGADVLLYGCFSTSLVEPWDWDDEFEAVARAAGVGRATTAAAALLAQLKASELKRVAVLSAYEGWIAEALPRYLRRAGVEVVEHVTLAVGGIHDIGRLEPSELRRAAGERVDGAADALCIAGTDLPTLPVVPALERDLGMPVLTANGALFAAAVAE